MQTSCLQVWRSKTKRILLANRCCLPLGHSRLLDRLKLPSSAAIGFRLASVFEQTADLAMICQLTFASMKVFYTIEEKMNANTMD